MVAAPAPVTVFAAEPSFAWPSGVASLPKAVVSLLYKRVIEYLTAANKGYGGPFLTGNFAPVSNEVLAQSLAVSGKLPAELSGVFMRTGPNPFFRPVGGYHWFDGDGMVHAVRIKGGKASYSNRWVVTSRLQQERNAGWPLFLKLGDYQGWRGVALSLLDKLKYVLGIASKAAGAGTANTALVHHASKLLALNEGDLPHSIRVLCNGLVETIGRVTYGSQPKNTFTAHPKVDPSTGKLHFFSYNFDKAPYVTYGVLGTDGTVEKTIPVDLPRPVMMHDFAIVAGRYAVFMDLPLCFDGERMVKEGQLPFRFLKAHKSRIGLLPMDASSNSQMRWFELDAFMVFHTATAWEEADGTVKLFGCAHDDISLNLDTRSDVGIPTSEQPRMAVVTLDPASGCASLRYITSTVGDFPTVNPNSVGRKTRYCYVATMVCDSIAVKWDGVAKLDLQAPAGTDALVKKLALPPGQHNGETIFVPRFEDPARCSGEDDGYLLSYVHDEAKGTSSLRVWNAKTMDPKALATVELPQRVPYGFHALFINETQFQQQLGSAA